MIVLACEGNTEVKLMRRLLEEDALIFSWRDILDQRPIHMRQMVGYQSMLSLVPYEEPLHIYRIGDTLKGDFYYNAQSRRALDGLIDVTKYCTKPECEILGILSEGWINEFERRRMMPKSFLRQFHPSFDFIDYLENAPIIKIQAGIKEYRQRKRHRADEHYLAELLKQ